MLRIVCLAVIFLALCQGQIQPPVIKASIDGQVTSPAGDPLPSSTVRMIRVDGPFGPSERTSWTAQTDPKGKFVFDQLEPGRYSILAEHSSFVRSSAAAISLGSGQHRNDVLLKLIPEARIMGKVVDQDRNPVPKPRLSVLRKIYFAGTPQFIRPVGEGAIETNADGTFTVSGLSAGRYYLFVPSPELGQRPGPEESYVNTYYPDATEGSGAVPIQVTAGVDVTGIEIRMRKERVIHIRGKVEDPTGAAPADNNRALMLYPQGASAAPMLRSAPLRNGEFEFDRVSPGTYTMVARVASLVGAEDIVVGKNNVDDMLVRVHAGGEISGKVAVSSEEQSGQPAHPTSIQIGDVGRDGTGAAATVAKDGTFVLRDVPAGAYRIYVNFIPPGQYTESIRSGGQDLMANPLVLGAEGRANIEVVMSPNVARVSGVMRDSDDAPLEGVTVSVWSDHFFTSATTNYDGAFDFRSLPPGDYRLLAWEKIDQGLDSLPEFRQKFDAKALTVKLDEKTQVNLVVPMISRDEIEKEAAKLP